MSLCTMDPSHLQGSDTPSPNVKRSRKQMEGEDGGQLQAGIGKKAKLHSNNIGDGLENTSPDSSSDARKHTEDEEGESSPALKASDSLMVGGPSFLK